MQVDEREIRTVQKLRKSRMEQIWNWRKLVMECEIDRLQRYSDCSFLMQQVKQDADAGLVRDQECVSKAQSLHMVA